MKQHNRKVNSWQLQSKCAEEQTKTYIYQLTIAYAENSSFQDHYSHDIISSKIIMNAP